MSRRSVHGHVSGRVQGVGFRYFVCRCAQALKLAGYVRNLRDGRVEFFAQGEAADVVRLIEQIRTGPAHARVSDLQFEDVARVADLTGFSAG
ncbi:MAG: acylphosphatase [Gammaproteobacteria bacterium]|nr:acylphosphatase [Gammaproteobacteria bacterium]